MNNNTAEDRREHFRHPITLEVFVTPENTDDKHLESRIVNMSLLGCAIEPIHYPFKQEEKMSICFVESKEHCSRSTIIDAEVAHIGNDYIGLCFDAMGTDVMQLLRDLLKEAKYF